MNIAQLKLHTSGLQILSAAVLFGYLELELRLDGSYNQLTYDGRMHQYRWQFNPSKINFYVSIARRNREYEEFCDIKTKIEEILLPVLPTIYLNPAAFNKLKQGTV